MIREQWDAIKALRPRPVRLTATTGQLKRAKAKKRRPSPIARHLAAQHVSSPARTAHFEAALAARDARRTPVKRVERVRH